MPPEATQAAPVKERRRVTFAKRLSSTLALWGAVGIVLATGHLWGYLALLGLLSLVALKEVQTMLRPGKNRWHKTVTYLVSAGYIAASYYQFITTGSSKIEPLDTFFLVLLLFGSFAVTLRKPIEGRATLDAITGDLFSFLYVVFLFNFIARLLVLPEGGGGTSAPGAALVIWLVAITKFTDMGAYAIGTWIGKHKMIPHISPGKTWQGFGGAILGALVASLGGLAIWGDKLEPITYFHGIILAVILGVVAVFGDLTESVVKRCLGAKDSGKFLPGIGGALDLIDSLCFTAPIFYAYLVYVVGI